MMVVPAVFETPSLLLSELYAQGNATVTGDFTIKNNTPEERQLTYSGADCFCVGLFHEERRLEGQETFLFEPGQEKAFQLTTNIPHQPGPWNYSAVFSGKGLPKLVRLKVTGCNYSDLTMSPSSLLGDFTKDTPKSFTETVKLTRTVRGTNLQSFPEPTVTDLPSYVKLLKVGETSKCQKLEEGFSAQSWEFLFEIHDDQTLTGSTPAQIGLIRFPASGALAEGVKPFTILVRRKIGVDAPEHATFGICSLNQSATRRIMIRSADDNAFQILKCETGSDVFSAQIVEDSEEQSHVSHWLELSFTPTETGEHSGILTLHTDHPDSSQVYITLHGIGQE